MKEINEVEIEYYKSGVLQKTRFQFKENKLLTREFFVSYNPKVTIPDSVVTLRELLRFMASYSYRANAVKIVSINRKNVLYKHRFNKDEMRSIRQKVEDFECKIANQYFDEFILPILKDRKWFFEPTSFSGQLTIAYYDSEISAPNNVHRDNRILERLNVICGIFSEGKDLDGFINYYISEETLKKHNLLSPREEN